MTIMRTVQIDQKDKGQETNPQMIEVTHQSESFLYTSDGQKLVDFVMGWCVGNFGWDNKSIKDRMRNFKGPDYISPHYHYGPWEELKKRLCAMAPGQLKTVYRATGGSEAVEMALGAAISFTKRTKFISLKDAYHGDTVLARSVGSPSFGEWYKSPFQTHRINGKLDAKSAMEVEVWLKEKDVAALIMEPIVCNRGVLVPDHEFMQIIQESCKKYGTLLIMDEVATGFGRTGKRFASEHYQLRPDIMTLGKAMSNGLAPIGATLMTEEVASAMNDEGHYSTYGWHPLSVEAALGTLDYFDQNFSFLEVNSRELGNYIVDQIGLMEFEEEPIICNKGLAIGVSFESEDYGERIVKQALSHGLVLSESEKGFCMFPALNITKSTVDEALNKLEASI